MFNLKKHSDLSTAPNDILDGMRDAKEDLSDQVDGVQPEIDEKKFEQQTLDPEQERISNMMAAQSALTEMQRILISYPPQVQGVLQSLPSYQQAQKDSKMFNPDSFGFNASPQKKEEFAKLKALSANNPRFVQTLQQFQAELGKINQLQQRQPNQPNQPINNTMFASKIAQSIFPVKNAADLANKLMPNLVTNNPDVFANTANQILSAVKGEIQEEEINSMIEALKMLDPNDRGIQDEALKIFGQMYDMLPNGLKMPMESNAMNNPKGIIKFDLSDHVLNNKASSEGLIKTAADQFGQQYLLYGPTEKRICPKLRGKGGGQPGSGDVVSEYICRHHCLDGIVIDDNKTICGEALWRANVMDKYSREYVDENGDITGGYLDKRFIIERNTPEENKMRLKPGETRKPRPAAWGSLESRMQDMRKKEADKRGYRPDSNKGDPFEWCHDCEQNNVEQTQSTRNKRETNSGHKIVEYKNNKSAGSSFNLKKFSQFSPPSGPENGPTNWESQFLDEVGNYIGPDLRQYGFPYKPGEWVPVDKRHSAMLEHQWATKAKTMSNDVNNTSDEELNAAGDIYDQVSKGDFYKGKRLMPGQERMSSFNLKKHTKTAQLAPVPLPQDGARSDRFLEDPKQRKPMISPGDPLNKNDSQNSDEDRNQGEDSVVVPGGDIVDSEEAKKREMKDLGLELMDWNGGQWSSIYQVASNWAIGNKVEPKIVRQAFEELQDAIDPVKFPEAITQDMIADAQNLMEKIRPFMNGGQEDNSDMPMSKNIPTMASKSKKCCKCNGKCTCSGFNLRSFKKAQQWEQEKFDGVRGKEKISGYSDEQLQFVLKDLNQVIKIQEEGLRSGQMNPTKLGYYYDERFAVQEEMKRRGIRPQAQKIAKSPPGWGGTVEKMKERHSDEIDNPFALAWWMQNKGNKPHYDEDGSKKDGDQDKKKS